MNTISNIMREMPQEKMRSEVHEKIMKRIKFHRYKWYFTAIYLLLGGNFIIAIQSIWNRAQDTNAISNIKALLDGFEVSPVFFQAFMQSIIEYFPLGWMLVAIANVAVMACILRLAFKMRKLEYAN